MTMDVSRANEARLLGSILFGPEIFKHVRLQITADHFQYAPHRRIFRVMEELEESGEALDELSIYQRARDTDQVEAIGGMGILTDLCQEVASSSAWAIYAERLRDADRRRRLLAVFRDQSSRIAQGDELGAVGMEAVQKIHEIIVDGRNQTRAMKDIAVEVYKEIQEAVENPNVKRGVPTRIAAIDNLVGNMNFGDLIVVAGRTSMGKTALMMSILRSSRAAALMVSAEMSGKQLVYREFSAGTGIPYHDLSSGKVPEHLQPALAAAAARVYDSKVEVIEPGAMTVSRIAEQTYRAKHQLDIDILAVDYLQILRADRRAERRDIEIGNITRDLKQLAKDLGIVVLAAAQIGRGAERDSGADKRPKLHHLRESASIEQDADRVYGIYRHSEYTDRMPDELTSISEVGILKNRNGPKGRVFLDFDGRTTSFVSAEPHRAAEYRQYLEAH